MYSDFNFFRFRSAFSGNGFILLEIPESGNGQDNRRCFTRGAPRRHGHKNIRRNNSKAPA